MEGLIGKKRIADLRHRVVIESLTDSTDGQGGFTAAWGTFSTVWGSIQPAKAWEAMVAMRVEYQKSHTCTIRYLAGVTTSMRIKFDSRYFQIKGIRTPDEKDFFMILDLEENQGT